MKKIGNYYHIDKDNVDIVPEKGSKIVSYYVSCFDRELVLILNDSNLEDKDIGEIEMQLDKSYLDWCCDEEPFECCEEYMISKLDDYYRNSIVAVLYIGDEN